MLEVTSDVEQTYWIRRAPYQVREIGLLMSPRWTITPVYGFGREPRAQEIRLAVLREKSPIPSPSVEDFIVDRILDVIDQEFDNHWNAWCAGFRRFVHFRVERPDGRDPAHAFGCLPFFDEGPNFSRVDLAASLRCYHERVECGAPSGLVDFR